ncbi:MAG TPA: type II toxin-antitoxin system PemK/MazF family toxin [Phycisphaerae bacterium]|nr:type II toxin-antitoxin system PemK/MazF family toxin [Phycisphaerae bacterium]
MPTPSAYRPGDIVRVRLQETRGGGKMRWMVVLSDLKEHRGQWCHLCAAITTTFPNPVPSVNVPVSWHPDGRACTGLRRRSAVVLDWMRRIPPNEILSKDGYLPDDDLTNLFRMLEAFEQNQRPT